MGDEVDKILGLSSDNQTVDSILGTTSSDSSNVDSILYPNSWNQFKQTATQMANNENFPASVLLGQAALESGHGTSSFAKNRNNYFGYQAYDSNPNAAKAYQSPEQSIQDYIDLIKNTPRYRWAYQNYLIDHDPVKLLQGIKSSGYATDPNYVNKVESMPEFGGKQ